ncbi:MAG: hypothetical protein E7465_09280 [Ruminococcaceae bacterium]|nr:hypothetical protein [Oscillospiraceae bacterium]
MKKAIRVLSLLMAALLLSGCTMRTVDEMYRLPRRSETDDHLQSAIDAAMADLNYAAPIAGENQQTVQMADLDGDGEVEYIVFARDSVNKAIRILIFDQEKEAFTLKSVIESHGSAFEQVEYVNIDNNPGVEMVIGRLVSDQVLRSLSVYSFSEGSPEQIMTSSYLKFLSCDLNEDGNTELMLIQPGETEADRGVAVMYSVEDGRIQRSREVELSAAGTSVKRIMTSRLESGEPAVYVASALEESAVITDIFTVRNGSFANISFSRESGTSVQTLRNYYVYADDIDSDGVLELPSLITMHPIKNSTSAEQQYLIRWYAMDSSGSEHTKRHTFHNYLGGWYLEVGEGWAERVSVIQTGNTFWFHVWDVNFETFVPVFSVHVLSGADREEAAESDNRFVLHRSDGVIYAARLESGAADYQITQEDLTPCFHLIHQAWKTGET